MDAKFKRFYGRSRVQAIVKAAIFYGKVTAGVEMMEQRELPPGVMEASEAVLGSIERVLVDLLAGREPSWDLETGAMLATSDQLEQTMRDKGDDD